MPRTLLSFLILIGISTPFCFAQRQFGFDNRKPSGQPYLKPEETVKKFKLAPGYQAQLFAGEPDLVNPIAFTIDERGRIWVPECFEYPKRTPPGKKPRDRIKILEDTNGDGKCDTVTVWAQGKDLPIGWQLASGLEVGYGGVFLGAPPYLFFLQDTDGDGKCDKQEILLKGFGSRDTHETLNTFQWGPDQRLYGLHGVFTHSNIGGVRMNAAVWRYDVPDKKFEVWAEGTSNPWGLDFDGHGQAHLACCVIPHLFHMVPGGTYRRQAGSSFNPYAYGLLPESCDHTHHKMSGWAHAGLVVLDGEHVPKSMRGSVIMGSIHGCSIKRDILRNSGSTFRAGHAPDFLISGDKNFRPINMRWGPDGAIYVSDWHDQNPCHQAHPDSWDYERGRIYRISYEGQKAVPSRDISKLKSSAWVELLHEDNPYLYRTALRMMAEKKDKSIAGELRNLALESAEEKLALRGLWGLYAIGAFDDKVAEKAIENKNPWVRHWGIRLAGESGKVSNRLLTKLTQLAKTEPSPKVRLQLASTCQRLKDQDVLPLLHNLMTHKEDVEDRFLPLMVWLAYEPRITSKVNSSLEWLKENASGNPLVLQEIVPRTLRRLVATRKKENLAACVEFLAVVDSEVRRKALEGMVAAMKNRQEQPPASWRRVFPVLLRDSDGRVKQLARKLAVNFQDREVIQLALRIANNKDKEVNIRIGAIRDLALSQPKEGLPVLLGIATSKKDAAEVRGEAVRALGGYENAEIADRLLQSWKSLPPPVKTDAVNLLSGRKEWARRLLDAVSKKQVARTDLSDNVVLKIRAFKDKSLNQQIEKAWGRYRKTPKQLSELINKIGNQLDEKRASFARGRLVFNNNCAKCHKFQSEGHEVGPNLDGASREIDYLLINVLDPNRVVGQPYYTRLVELKNGRIETGLLHAEDPESITLKVENNALKVIQRKDIEGKVLIQPKSVMPEGLANNLKLQGFRDLIRYMMTDPFITDVAISEPRKAKLLSTDPVIESKILSASRKPLVGVTGRIPLPDVKSQDDHAVYVVSHFTSHKAIKTNLRLGSTNPLKVYLNKKLIYNGTPGKKKIAPDQVQVPANLQKGGNSLLIEVRYRGENNALYARFRDPDRLLIYGDYESSKGK